jgi:hypothetical protein
VRHGDSILVQAQACGWTSQTEVFEKNELNHGGVIYMANGQAVAVKFCNHVLMAKLVFAMDGWTRC